MTTPKTRRYLITGGAGFIGQAMTAALVAKGAQVVVLDLPGKIAELPNRTTYQAIAGDIAESNTYSQLDAIGPFDVVLHLAAQTSNRVSHEEPERDVYTNALGTLKVVEWCSQKGIKRLLFSSSMAIYGNPDRLPISEKDSAAPFSYYGITKLAGEHYIRANAWRGVNATIFRLFNVYGPGQNMRNLKQGMASIYLAYILKGEKIPVTGSLERFRDFIYIDDVVDAWMRIIDDPRSYGQTFNLGTGVTTTVRNLVNLLIRFAGQNPESYPVEQVAGHAGDQFGMVADASAFASTFNWNPRVDLNEGIRRMVAWAKESDCHLNSKSQNNNR